jgi:hypothetical protein
MARKKLAEVGERERRAVGALLRDVRRAAGYRSVERAAATPGCPAARQTIYAYERGGLVPSLAQFLDLVEFYATTPTPDAAPPADLRARAVAAIAAALTLPNYQVSRAVELMRRLQPALEGTEPALEGA